MISMFNCNSIIRGVCDGFGLCHEHLDSLFFNLPHTCFSSEAHAKDCVKLNGFEFPEIKTL